MTLLTLMNPFSDSTNRVLMCWAYSLQLRVTGQTSWGCDQLNLHQMTVAMLTIRTLDVQTDGEHISILTLRFAIYEV